MRGVPYRFLCLFALAAMPVALGQAYADSTPPAVVNCPLDMLTNTAPGQCGQVVNYELADTNNPGFVLLGCAPPSGASFPIGTNLVTCLFTNTADGQTNSCSFQITVVNSKPSPVVLMGIEPEDGSSVNKHGPISTWQRLGSNILSQAVSGSGILVLGGGKNTNSPPDDVTWFWRAIGTGCVQTVTFVNGSNAIATQSFSGFKMIGIVSDYIETPSGGLTLAENNALQLRAGDIAAFVNGGGALWGLYSQILLTNSAGPFPYMAALGGVTVRSNGYSNVTPTPSGIALGIDQTLSLQIKGSLWHQVFLTYPSYMQPLCYRSNSLEAAAIGGAQVLIPLSCAPPATLACSGSLTLTAQVYNVDCAASTVTWSVDGLAVQTNLLTGQTGFTTPTLTWFFGPGRHTVRVDLLGGLNAHSCETTVTIDTTPPQITCPSTITTNTPLGRCDATVAYTVTAHDNCSSNCTVFCLPPSGSTFPKGTNVVACRVADEAGNTNTCTFKVVVVDGEPPQITCPGDILTNAPPGACSVVINYSAVLSDNCSGGNLVCVPPPSAVFPKGATTVTCTAIDAASHSNSCSFMVTVQTTLGINPLADQLACRGDTVQFNTGSGEGFQFSWRLDGQPVGSNTLALVVPTAPLAYGAHQVEVTVSNACAAASSQATLTVGSSISVSPMTNLTRCVCEGAIFSPVVTGFGPASYVWRLNGQWLEEQTNGSLVIPTVRTTDAGVYTVEVASPCNVVTQSATLALEAASYMNPATFTNAAAILINDQAPATPYPSAIQVRCLPGLVTKATIAVRGLTHSFAGDIDMMLANPSGQTVMLMSDTGNRGGLVTNINLTFDDYAASYLPSNTLIISGTYKPTNYNPAGQPADFFPAPAPTGTIQATLDTFTGSGGNGTWSLYVVDDAQADSGMIVGGWSLTLWWDPTEPRIMSAAILMPQKRLHLFINSLPNLPHVIEASADLKHWEHVGGYNVGSPDYEFIGTDPPSPTRRFYRVLRCPEM